MHAPGASSRTPAQGMACIGDALEGDVPRLQRLWVHEALRVYSDRLVDDADREWVAGAIRAQAEKHFGVDFDRVRTVGWVGG